ncbi:MAG: GlcG/HbpS family heme-binding protein [Stellaceae bacterium]
MANVSLAQASIITDKALEHARSLKLKPLTVAVLDAGGHLVALKREDNASLLRPQIAQGKAWGVLGMGFGGREFARRAAASPAFIAAIGMASEGRIIPVAGGVLIRAGDGGIVGSVGISGDLSDQDEACAVHGITAAGLVPDTGDPA